MLAALRIILYGLALILLVWSGYLVKVKGDQGKLPMILAIAGLLIWGIIFAIEKSM